MKTILLAVLLLANSSSVLHAQRGRMMMPNYDAKAEVTIKGTVEKVVTPMQMGVHLMVKTESDTLEVHLGPASFVEKTMSFKEGDQVEIVGSKVTMMGKPALIAREVRKGGQVLKLRSEQGVPLWSRGRMGR